MTDTVTDFRRTLEQETETLTTLCQLWTTKLVNEKTRMSEEVEVGQLLFLTKTLLLLIILIMFLMLMILIMFLMMLIKTLMTPG